MLLAQSCSQCQNAGKNVKTFFPQSDFGKLLAAESQIDEIALDFAGPFNLAPENKKYRFVAIDHKTNPAECHVCEKTYIKEGFSVSAGTNSTIWHSLRNKNRPGNHFPRRKG